MTNDDDIKFPEIMRVPDYPLLVANELVDVVGLPPPDGKWLIFDIMNPDELFNDIKNNKDTTNETDTDN